MPKHTLTEAPAVSATKKAKTGVTTAPCAKENDAKQAGPVASKTQTPATSVSLDNVVLRG
jgi:hypothetical protein